MKPSFIILRTKKLHNLGNIGGASAHVARNRDTPNADPEREIVCLVGDTDAMVSVRRRLEDATPPVRSNSVLAVEVFIGASPEFFTKDGTNNGAWDQAKIDAFAPRAVTWLKEEWGEENLASAFLHLDEKTPHLHAIVVPLDPETGRLNARRWLGGRSAMSALQDRCSAAFSDLGLERGIKGSKAKHTSVSQWYAQMNAAVPEVPAPTIDPPTVMNMLSPKRWAEEQAQRLANEQVEAVDALKTQARAFKEANKKRKQVEDTNQALRSQVNDGKKAEANLSQNLVQRDQQVGALQNHAKQFRDIPLHQVAGLFPTGFLARRGITLATDEHNRDRIRNAEGKVIGRNAIDLVMQATGMPFDQSVAWLKDRLGPEMATQAAVAKAITQVKSRLKPVDPKEWQIARVAKAVSLSVGQTLADARKIFALFDLNIQATPQGISVQDQQLRCLVSMSPAWGQEQVKVWGAELATKQIVSDIPMPRSGMRR